MHSNVGKKRQGDSVFQSSEHLSTPSVGRPAKKQNISSEASTILASELDSPCAENVSKMEVKQMLLPPSTGQIVQSSGSHDQKKINKLNQNLSTVSTGKKTSAVSKSSKFISSIKEKNIFQENSAIPIKVLSPVVSKGKSLSAKEKTKELKQSEKENSKFTRNEQLSITDYVKESKSKNISSASQHSKGQFLQSKTPPQSSLGLYSFGDKQTLQNQSNEKSQPNAGMVEERPLMNGGTVNQVQKPSYATVAESNKFSLPSNMGNDQRISPERGIYLTRISNSSLSDYADAITAAIGESGLTHISLVSKKHVLAFLSDVSHVKFLVINGLSLNGQFLNPAYMRPPALKIVLSNVYPLISNLDIIKVLEPFGRVIPNSFRAIRASTNQKNILSFRKEILFVAKENTEVPTDVQVSVFGYTFKIYLSRDGLKCSKCNKQGHPSSKCRQNMGEAETLTETACTTTSKETFSVDSLTSSKSNSEDLHKSENAVSVVNHSEVSDILNEWTEKPLFTNVSAPENLSQQKTKLDKTEHFKVPTVPRQVNSVSSQKISTTQSSECFDSLLANELTVQNVKRDLEHPETLKTQQDTLKGNVLICNDGEVIDKNVLLNSEEDEGSDSDTSLQESIYSMDSVDGGTPSFGVGHYTNGPLTLEQIKSLLRRIHKKQGESRLNIVREYTENFDALKFQLETLFMTGTLWKNKTGRDRKLRSSKSCLRHLIKTVDLLDQLADEEYESDNSFGGMN